MKKIRSVIAAVLVLMVLAMPVAAQSYSTRLEAYVEKTSNPEAYAKKEAEKKALWLAIYHFFF